VNPGLRRCIVVLTSDPQIFSFDIDPETTYDHQNSLTNSDRS
jgi:hypothetical protein